MSFIGALNFSTKFIEKLHINHKPFYELLLKILRGLGLLNMKPSFTN